MNNAGLWNFLHIDERLVLNLTRCSTAVWDDNFPTMSNDCYQESMIATETASFTCYPRPVIYVHTFIPWCHPCLWCSWSHSLHYSRSRFWKTMSRMMRNLILHLFYRLYRRYFPVASVSWCDFGRWLPSSANFKYF